MQKVDAGTQEIRIAAAMTGGVSLAIWMGGVAREMNLLQQAAWRRHSPAQSEADEGSGIADGMSTADREVRNLYLRLLGVLNATVSIDMLSGTSAGGINGALLALAGVESLDLSPLRDFWLRHGAFEELLRDPAEKNPPSLLQGDGVLFKELLNAIKSLPAASPGYRRPPNGDNVHDRTQLFITTTLLTGETSRFTDSFGTLVQDDDHRGLFSFTERDLHAANDEERRAVRQILGLAARCSASYPAAFEPAFLPYKDAVEDDHAKRVIEHPAMKKYANVTRDHWVADGGLLANRPIAPLLQSIFDAPAERRIRRVLLYVVPSPGEAPDPRTSPAPESFDAPWTLGKSLVKDLGSMLGQSITADLHALRRHNDRVSALRDTRLRMAEFGNRTPARPGAVYRLWTDAMLSDYRAREATWLVRPVIDALMRAVTTMTDAELPEEWAVDLGPGGTGERICREKAAEAVSAHWTKPARGDWSTLAGFGRPAFDGAKATVLAMLQAAHLCCPDRREWLQGQRRKVHQAFAANRPDPAQMVADKLSKTRAGQQSNLPDLAGSLAEAYAAELAGNGADQPGTPLEDGWKSLVQVAKELTELKLPQQTAPSHASPFARPSARARTARAARELRTYQKFLSSRPLTIACRLLELHVATRSVLPVGVDVDQAVELIQVSADTRSALAPTHNSAKDKLTGLQLHHFGAFYKPSWRANDWAWGRLDGAGWLVHMLLDPQRVLELADALPRRSKQDKAQWFYRQLLDHVVAGAAPGNEVVDSTKGEPTVLTQEAVLDELSFLNDPHAAVPPSLPLTALWVARSWQEWIAANELPVIAGAMIATPATRHDPWALEVLQQSGNPELALAAAQAAVAATTSGRWSEQLNKLIKLTQTSPANSTPPAQQPTPVAVAEFARKMESCPVPHEQLADELGEPLFTRTVTKALATTTATVTGIEEPPASIKPFLSSARTVTLVGYRASSAVGGSPRWLTIIGLGCIVVGVAAMTMRVMLVGLAGAGVTAIGCLLIGLAAWGWRRWIAPAMALVLCLILLAVLTVGRWKWFGKGECGDKCYDPGTLGKAVLDWLHDPFWRPAAGLLILLATIVILGAVIPRLFRLLGGWLKERARAVWRWLRRWWTRGGRAGSPLSSETPRPSEETVVS